MAKRKTRVPAEMVHRPAVAFSQVFVNADAERLYKHFMQSAQPTHVECDFAPEPSDGHLQAQIRRLGWQRLSLNSQCGRGPGVLCQRTL